MLSAIHFFENDYVDQASYDNLRKISSCVDGLKNASRKVIHTILDKKVYDLTKVSQLSSKAGEYADYLHGSLDGVVVTLAQDFLGSNQTPLLHRKGNFGTRSIPEASASRYIFACGSKNLKELFNEQDKPLLVEQWFEGYKIEPMYYVPELPMLLLNGSKGVSSGFAQNILSRTRSEIEQIINEFCTTKDVKVLNKIAKVKPFVFDFKGDVQRDPENLDVYKWLFTTKFEIEKNKVILHDLPYGSDLRGFINFLDKLEDDKKIKKWDDLTDEDYLFEITFDKAAKLTKDSVIKTLKLQTSITENFTCIDENNKIFEAKDPVDILKRYVKVKIQYLEKRKALILENLELEMNKLESMMFFIQAVLDGFEFKGKSAKDLNKFFDSNKLFKVEGDTLDGYGYLHRIQMGKIVQEEVQALKAKIEKAKVEVETIKNTTIFELWINR